MKINRRSYNLIVSADERFLFNVGGTASVFDISREEAFELIRFCEFSNLSNIAISPEEKLIAYKNTSGHVAVHNIETGKLIMKSKCLSKEGKDLYFINDNQIISSERDGKVFIFDFLTETTDIVAELPINNPNIIPVGNNYFIVFGLDERVYTRVFMLTLDGNSTCKELHQPLPFTLASDCAVLCGENILFYGDSNRNESEWRPNTIKKFMGIANSAELFTGNADIFSKLKHYEKDLFQNKNAVDVIISFNLTTNKMQLCLIIQELINQKGDLLAEYGYFTCMCISKDGRYLLIGYSSSILAVDLIEKKHLGTVEVKYTSSLHFVCSDTKVVIGTWNNIQIVSFRSLFNFV